MFYTDSLAGESSVVGNLADKAHLGDHRKSDHLP